MTLTRRHPCLRARGIVAALASLLFLASPFDSIAGDAVREAYVRWVVDGDTVILANGEHVRYVGVDTPERGEPFYGAARRRNAGLVKGRTVRLVVCAEEPKDKYGRTLAWVWADGVSVNEALLREGLARTLVIPPCGLKKREEYAVIEAQARGRRTGIWSRHR